MKKVIGMALAALLIICCGSHQQAVGTNTKSDSSKLAPAKAVKHLEAGKSAKYYLDYARWGNTDGYLNLARCYRNGIGVERNFYRSLALITTLQNFDGKFDSDAFYRELPDDDLMRMYYECVNQIGRQEQKPYIGEVAERLIEKGNPDGYALKGVMALEGGRIEESDSHVRAKFLGCDALSADSSRGRRGGIQSRTDGTGGTQHAFHLLPAGRLLFGA